MRSLSDQGSSSRRPANDIWDDIITNMEISDLQSALDKADYQGRVIKTFSSKFGQLYQVGLAELTNGEKVVIKIKDNPRSEKYGIAYSREAEYKNLKSLELLEEPSIPKAIYYKDGVLIMSYIPGESLRTVDQSTLNHETFKRIGSVLRKINELDISNFSHLIRFDSFREVLEHEFELLYRERLALTVLPQSFYDEFRKDMFSKVKDQYPADIVLVAKDAYGAENILVNDGTLSGLIDFEDLMIAPRLLQLRPPLEEMYMQYYIEGYGREVFEKNYYKPHLLILKAVSSLRAFYLATERKDVAFQKTCINNLKGILSDLGSQLVIPFSN